MTLQASNPLFCGRGLNYKNGISVAKLARALCRCRPSTRAHVLENIEPVLAAAVRDAIDRVPHSDIERICAAELELVAVYFWHIVYRKFPEEYEKFAACQRFRLNRLFPPAQYAGATVLDIGCGTGKLVDHLARTAGLMHAVDPLESMLDVARTKHRSNTHVRFAIGTFRAIPLAINRSISSFRTWRFNFTRALAAIAD